MGTARRGRGQVTGALACALFVAGGACSSAEEPDKKEDAFSVIPHATSFEDPRVNAAPRWEPLDVLKSSTGGSYRFDISADAIQWRARWDCRNGTLSAEVDPAPQEDEAFIDASCPRTGESFSVDTGSISMTIDATGPWKITLEQQVDTPVHEPPLEDMTSPDAEVIAKGDFYAIEREGEGRALLYRLQGDRLALRFEGFETSANVGLFVWVSGSERPRSTKQAFRSDYVQIAELKSTAGEQNYVLPESVTEREARSVIIWCEPIRIAYVAASLKRAQDP